MSSILSNRLGVELSDDVLSANPGFANLLMALSEHMDSDGVSKDVKDKADNIKATLMKHKEAYFAKLILFDEIQSILMERKFNSVANESNDTLWDMFVDSNCKELISTDGEDLNLFGLSEDNFMTKPENKKLLGSDIQMVLSKLESNLKDKCDTISNVYKLQADEFQLEEPASLPSLIERDLKDLKRLKVQQKEQQSKRMLLFNQFYDCLTKSSRLLTDIMKIYRLQKIPDNNTTTIQWLVSRCDALCAKTRVMELQLLHETYSKDALKALTVIRKELNQSSEETDKELKQVTALLNSYASLGDEFQAVVKEYAKVKDEIDNRKWALEQLN